MNNSNYMFNKNLFKDIGFFSVKKQFMPSHMIKHALDDPKSSEMYYT